MVDLNTRIPDAPAGLVLSQVFAIANNGEILAGSNAGLVLLKPGAGTAFPVVGPISPTGPVAVGTSVVFAVHFTDANAGETHSATWSWADGSADTVGKIDEANGAGTASASHVFASAGVYPVFVTVTDSAGHGTTVSRNVEAQ